jgi:hypothetical protein
VGAKISAGLADARFADWQGLHDLLGAAFAEMNGRIDAPSSLLAMTPGDLRRRVRFCRHP